MEQAWKEAMDEALDKLYRTYIFAEDSRPLAKIVLSALPKDLSKERSAAIDVLAYAISEVWQRGADCALDNHYCED